MQYAKRFHFPFNTRRAGLFGAAVALGLIAPISAAQAQAQNPGAGLAKTALGFLSTGGYFITGSARHAIGSTKFYSEGAFYVRPKHIGALSITGGVELIGASDHFFPFSGGDYFNLVGPSVRVTTSQDYHGIRPYVSAGAFYGQLRSTQLGFDRSAFTPSISFGADWKFSKALTLSASYRVSQEINGFNTDGFGLYLKIF